MTTTTPINGKAGHPTKSEPANDHAPKCTGCTCGKQQFPMTRKDIFAAVALHALIEKEGTSDSIDIARRAATIAHHAEFMAQARIGGTR